MSMIHQGGCLCGEVRYQTTAEPVRITICHCTFCQRLTGSAYLVEPVFKREHVLFGGVRPTTYDHKSDTSGKRVTLHFCKKCATTVCLDLERFLDILGICGGTFDDPNWFDRATNISRHIFIRSAQSGVILPSGCRLYEEHAFRLDGVPNEPTILAHALVIAR